jgi:hypothetical protein
VIDIEMVVDKFFLKVFPALRLQEGYLEKVILIHDFLRYAQISRIDPQSGYTAAFTVASVVHLPRGFEDVAALDLDAGGETGDTAAAFLFLFEKGLGQGLLNHGSPGLYIGLDLASYS